MPAQELQWVSYEVSDAQSIAAGATVTIQIPDLTGFAGPADKAKILLESAAEIEHALMVQYLYAAYSLKGSDEVTDAAQQAALDETSPDSWPQVLLDIAREEMGHLLTVQHLLLTLGEPPNLEREDFPPRKDLYPFPLHLEPLSQSSLAKYVVAEAPANATGLDDVLEKAQVAAGAAVNRVGMVYGLLGVVFSGPDQVAAGSDHADWDDLVRQLSEAAYRQSPPETWHLPDDAFHADAADRQAVPEDWQVGQLRVHQVTDRASALEAIRDIGEQGEGATGTDTGSHYHRLLGIYRGGDGAAAFPDPGGWQAARDVPTDPKVDADITEPRARAYAALADLRYALLLGFIEHYLLTASLDRDLLAGWIVAEMRSRVAYLARALTGMPRDGGGGHAAMPFTLPDPLDLPADEAARWALHAERTHSAVTVVEAIRSAGAGDDDRYLADLLASDQARLTYMGARADGAPAKTSFARDIGPLFRPKDVRHMAGVGLDLADPAAARRAADNILKRVQSGGPRRMPPAPDQRWTPAQIRLLERWVADGCPD